MTGQATSVGEGGSPLGEDQDHKEESSWLHKESLEKCLKTRNSVSQALGDPYVTPSRPLFPEPGTVLPASSWSMWVLRVMLGHSYADLTL